MRQRTPLLLAALILLLQACASAPERAPSAEADQVPEITLNLPQEGCQCAEQPPHDYTFLERGYSALAVAEYIEAVQYFQRYQRLESSPGSDWEAGVAIAFVSTLPNSPFYDPREARNVYRRLRVEDIEGLQIHPTALLMRQALEMFLDLDRENRDLKVEVSALSEDLEKREAALKRLRELTLGQ
jgi:hypothetical protein